MSSVPSGALPVLRDDERLGRSVFSGSAAKRARSKGIVIRNVFLEAQDVPSISVDHMDHAPLQEMADLAAERGRNRSPVRELGGWAIISVRDSASNGRTVEAVPHLGNVYHADIFLNIDEEEKRDRQKQHAADLAARSRWLEAP